MSKQLVSCTVYPSAPCLFIACTNVSSVEMFYTMHTLNTMLFTCTYTHLCMHGMCWSMHVSDTLYQLGSFVYLKLNTTNLKSVTRYTYVRTFTVTNTGMFNEELVTASIISYLDDVPLFLGQRNTTECTKPPFRSECENENGRQH